MHPPPLTIGQCTMLACLLEATAAKPGNVHRGADFEDLTYLDLLTAGAMISPVMDAAAHRRVGESVLAAVRATRAAIVTNANLGIVLLLAPLAKVPREVELKEGVVDVLAGLELQDARDVYSAIRLANPGGLGSSGVADVANEPTLPLVDAMRLAADHDLVARQYSGGFREVLGLVVPWLADGAAAGGVLSDVIVRTHLKLLAEFPDSLVLRKAGERLAREVSDRAAAVLASGLAGENCYERTLRDFDFWLRADGNRRNPGTTADLVAAGLFAALRDGIIKIPFRFYQRS